MGAPSGMDMSLDDLVKRERKAKPRGNPRGGSGRDRGPKGGGRGGRSKGGGGGSILSRLSGGGGRPDRGVQKGGRDRPMRDAWDRPSRREPPRGAQEPSRTYYRWDPREFTPRDRLPPRGGGEPSRDGKAPPPRETCEFEHESQDVAVAFRGNRFVRIQPSGDVFIDTHGFHNGTVLRVLQRALEPMGMTIANSKPDDVKSDWYVDDGSSLHRFSDGIHIKSKGAHCRDRGTLVLQAYGHPRALGLLAQGGDLWIVKGQRTQVVAHPREGLGGLA